MELQQSERAWLRQVRTYCSANAKEQQQADCLITAYNARLKSLEHAAVKMGPFVFRSVDILQADETTHAMTEVSYPQIDQPITATTTTWNRLIARDFARLTAPNCTNLRGKRWRIYHRLPNDDSYRQADQRHILGMDGLQWRCAW